MLFVVVVMATAVPPPISLVPKAGSSQAQTGPNGQVVGGSSAPIGGGGRSNPGSPRVTPIPNQSTVSGGTPPLATPTPIGPQLPNQSTVSGGTPNVVGGSSSNTSNNSSPSTTNNSSSLATIKIPNPGPSSSVLPSSIQESLNSLQNQSTNTLTPDQLNYAKSEGAAGIVTTDTGNPVLSRIKSFLTGIGVIGDKPVLGPGQYEQGGYATSAINQAGTSAPGTRGYTTPNFTTENQRLIDLYNFNPNGGAGVSKATQALSDAQQRVTDQLTKNVQSQLNIDLQNNPPSSKADADQRVAFYNTLLSKEVSEQVSQDPTVQAALQSYNQATQSAQKLASQYGIDFRNGDLNKPFVPGGQVTQKANTQNTLTQLGTAAALGASAFVPALGEAVVGGLALQNINSAAKSTDYSVGSAVGSAINNLAIAIPLVGSEIKTAAESALEGQASRELNAQLSQGQYEFSPQALKTGIVKQVITNPESGKEVTISLNLGKDQVANIDRQLQNRAAKLVDLTSQRQYTILSAGTGNDISYLNDAIKQNPAIKQFVGDEGLNQASISKVQEVAASGKTREGYLVSKSLQDDAGSHLESYFFTLTKDGKPQNVRLVRGEPSNIPGFDGQQFSVFRPAYPSEVASPVSLQVPQLEYPLEAYNTNQFKSIGQFAAKSQDVSSSTVDMLTKLVNRSATKGMVVQIGGEASGTLSYYDLQEFPKGKNILKFNLFEEPKNLVETQTARLEVVDAEPSSITISRADQMQQEIGKLRRSIFQEKTTGNSIPNPVEYTKELAKRARSAPQPIEFNLENNQTQVDKLLTSGGSSVTSGKQFPAGSLGPIPGLSTEIIDYLNSNPGLLNLGLENPERSAAIAALNTVGTRLPSISEAVYESSVQKNAPILIQDLFQAGNEKRNRLNPGPSVTPVLGDLTLEDLGVNQGGKMKGNLPTFNTGDFNQILSNALAQVPGLQFNQVSGQLESPQLQQLQKLMNPNQNQQRKIDFNFDNPTDFKFDIPTPDLSKIRTGFDEGYTTAQKRNNASTSGYTVSLGAAAFQGVPIKVSQKEFDRLSNETFSGLETRPVLEIVNNNQGSIQDQINNIGKAIKRGRGRPRKSK